MFLIKMKISGFGLVTVKGIQVKELVTIGQLLMLLSMSGMNMVQQIPEVRSVIVYHKIQLELFHFIAFALVQVTSLFTRFVVVHNQPPSRQPRQQPLLL
jgi:uncharacterized membrane protein